MSQCCGKIPSSEDVEAIRETIIQYYEERAEKDAIRAYIENQTRDAENKGTPSSGQTVIQQDGGVKKISPHNQGEVFQVEIFEKDGSIHYTTVNSATNTRHSYTVTSEGKITKDHTTNQNVSKGSKNRHK